MKSKRNGREMPDEIADEHDRAVQQGDDDHLAPFKIAFDLAAQFRDALGEHLVSDEDASDFFAPTEWHGCARAGEFFPSGVAHRLNSNHRFEVSERIFNKPIPSNPCRQPGVSVHRTARKNSCAFVELTV